MNNDFDKAVDKVSTDNHDELGMPRILADLAEGALDDDEANAVVGWLMVTTDEEPPSWIVNRAVRIASQSVGQDAPHDRRDHDARCSVARIGIDRG